MSFFQKIKDGAAKAADKAQRTVETTKLSAQISRKRKEVKDNYTEIGSAVYKAYQAGNLSLAEPEIARLSQENAAIEAAIASLHLKISQINDDRLCVCGFTADADASYCPACGRKLEDERPAAADATASTELEGSLPNEFEQVGPEEWTEEWSHEETPVYEGIEEIRCEHCKEEFGKEEARCPHCGALQAEPEPDSR